MTLQERISAFITAVGADINALYGRSVPSGGTTGQVLTKSSGADYAATWSTPALTQAKLDEIEILNWFWL
jgi:hypothetical protein